MPVSPTQRTLAYARKEGWTIQVVERWIPQARRRVDLFGCIDLVALTDEPGVLGIQACASSSHAARRTKAMEEPRLVEWLRRGNTFEVWSWGKRGAAGKRKLWALRKDRIALDELEATG